MPCTVCKAVEGCEASPVLKCPECEPLKMYIEISLPGGTPMTRLFTIIYGFEQALGAWKALVPEVLSVSFRHGKVMPAKSLKAKAGS